MSKPAIITALMGVALLISGRLCAFGEGDPAEAEIGRQIAEIRRIEQDSDEETTCARNKRLTALFEDYLRLDDGRAVGEKIRRFNALVSRQGMTNFDDFLAAMTRPVRYVRDPASGDAVPVFGALGSDVINPWLAAAGVAEGRRLEEQPMYLSAIRALRENVEFVVIGVRDPSLSLNMLPPEMHENARWAYRRLNPENRFEGGFDHPLFYCVVREAAEKLFREDHPQARITMADLVVPEAKGGFGINSCLLCHERDHSGVYRRLLGQGLYLEAKAAELREARRAGQADGGDEDPEEVEAEGKMFLLAARHVHEAFPEKIDTERVRQSLVDGGTDDLERLKPGYDDFASVLKRLECLNCHSTEATTTDALNPAIYGAYVLHPSAYHKTDNVRALRDLIDFEDLGRSKLLTKAMNQLQHEGATDVKLDAAQVHELRVALEKWVNSFHEGNEAAH